MSDDKLLSPVLDTDIPTSDNFFTRVTHGVYQPPYSSGSGNTPGTTFPPPPCKLSHRYAQAAQGIISMDNTPLGHGENQGIWAISGGQDASYGQPDALRAFFHKTAGHPNGYKTGWQPLDPTLILGKPGVNPNGDYFNTFTTSLYGQVASQRNGDYVYMLANTEWHDIEVASTGSLYSHYKGLLRLIKIDPKQNYTVQDFPLPERSDQFPVAIPRTCPLPAMTVNNEVYSNGLYPRIETFVSDDDTPFIWQTGGDISLDALNSAYPQYVSTVRYNAMPTVTGFADNGSGPGTWSLEYGTNSQGQATITNHITGQVGAYFQRYRCPSNQYGFGPYVVFPWVSGAYGPPELWYFMMPQHVSLGSTFTIYRSKWARNQFQRNADVILDDDPDFMNNNRQFPKLNPDGYAFDHNWFKPANKVGVVGPFKGAAVSNTVLNYGGPDPTPPFGQILVDFPFFKIVRDRHRIGQLSIVFSSGVQTVYATL